jgi:hypothetical protein
MTWYTSGRPNPEDRPMSRKPMLALTALAVVAWGSGVATGVHVGRSRAAAEPVPVGEPSAMVVRGGWDREGKPAPVTHLARDGKTVWKGEPAEGGETLVRVTLPAEGHTWDAYVRLPGR